MSGCGCEMETRNARERKTLMIVLAINAFMFIFELVLGLIAESTGLIADSLDMFADASVYSISLYAIGKSAALKGNAAKFSGVLQSILAFLVLFDVVRRFMLGSEPVSALMMVVKVSCPSRQISHCLFNPRQRTDSSGCQGRSTKRCLSLKNRIIRGALYFEYTCSLVSGSKQQFMPKKRNVSARKTHPCVKAGRVRRPLISSVRFSRL